MIKYTASTPNSIIQWISVVEGLPPLNKFVLVYRRGGINNHNDVGIAYRRHVYGTRDDVEWIETGMNQDYWGLSVDGSEITHWAYKPSVPGEITNE